MNPKSKKEKNGFGDSERYIEIPWAISKYTGEQIVLDVGYANAEERYIQALLSLKIPQLHGLDICEKSIEGIIPHIGDIRSTDFEDNFFDLVFCISTIEHIGRDNSVYKANSSENVDNGDFKALKEIYRITKNRGKLLLTVPFGKFHNYGWFIHYDESLLNKLLCSTPFKIIEKKFFKYEEGWQNCDESELANILYKDNEAPAAAGLVCVLLEKTVGKPVSIQKETTNEFEGTMSDNTIEIDNDIINVEDIMATIRENIRKRQSAGELPPDPDSVIISTPKNDLGGELDDTFKRDLAYLHTNWDIHNNSYVINSHHPIVGKLLIKGRFLVNGEVRRYVDPIISWQTEFNASTVRFITRISQRCDELNQHQQDLEMAFFGFKQEADKKITDCINITKNELDSKIEITTKKQAENLEFLRHEFNTLLKQYADALLEQERIRIKETVNESAKEIFSLMDEDIQAHAWIVNVLEERIKNELAQKKDSVTSSTKGDINYFLFEEKFRGSREVIAQRQLAFLPYFKKCSRVLDIGSGRGEFLEVLKNHNIGSIGVDIDPDMVEYCRSRQLEVEHSDAITYLETLEDKSLDGIFIDQVVEHLEPDYLIRLLALCNQKLKFGYYIVVETVNPLSFISFVNFYIDMTHKRPVHPETLQYLFSAVGFRECEKKFFSPLSDECRLKKIEMVPDINKIEMKNIDIYNHNIEILNAVLFGAQDYAVVGKK